MVLEAREEEGCERKSGSRGWKTGPKAFPLAWALFECFLRMGMGARRRFMLL